MPFFLAKNYKFIESCSQGKDLFYSDFRKGYADKLCYVIDVSFMRYSSVIHYLSNSLLPFCLWGEITHNLCIHPHVFYYR